MIVSKRISFDAAHFLPHHEGKCKELHGHRWELELAVQGEVDGRTGMVIDFAELKDFLGFLEDTLDHRLVNDTIPNPTAENICLWVGGEFELWQVFLRSKGVLVELAWVKVWETGDSYALLS